MAKPSYEGLTFKELKALHKQWLRAKVRVRCEMGHQECGCSSESTQDGLAPCHEEVVNEFRWRNAAVETVEAE